MGLIYFENNPPAAANSGWWNNAINFQVAQYRIKTFLCPSDDPDSSTYGVFIWLQVEVLGGEIYYNPTGNLFGKTNYIGSAGSIGNYPNTFYRTYRGPFYNRSAEKLASIRDGNSVTALFGESLLGRDTGTRDYAGSWFGVGYWGHAWGLPTPSQWYTFGSKHPQVVNFARADGSVTPIRKGVGTSFFTADWYQYNRFGGTNDGELVDFGMLE